MVAGDVTIRRSVPADRPAVLELCRRSLGWSPDGHDEAFFAWKHEQNPFGVSPAWVAESDSGQIVGLRVFLRWRFLDGSTPIVAVRAVDTATDPEWQGRGIFTRLTRGALPDLRDDGIDAVFNTPNDKSRPGYLKMGWSVVGRVPVSVRVSSPGSLQRVAAARAAAEMWSEPTNAGVPARDALADTDALDRLLAGWHPAGIRTDASAAFLQWRYDFAPLNYRVALVGDDLAGGLVVFRVRRRGGATEGAICAVVAPPDAPVRDVFSRIARESGADYLLAGATSVSPTSGFMPAPRLGPIFTWRPTCRAGVPSMRSLRLDLGDIELF